MLCAARVQPSWRRKWPSSPKKHVSMWQCGKNVSIKYHCLRKKSKDPAVGSSTFQPLLLSLQTRAHPLRPLWIDLAPLHLSSKDSLNFQTCNACSHMYIFNMFSYVQLCYIYSLTSTKSSHTDHTVPSSGISRLATCLDRNWSTPKVSPSISSRSQHSNLTMLPPNQKEPRPATFAAFPTSIRWCFKMFRDSNLTD